MSDIRVECSRCRNKHMESERLQVPSSKYKTSGLGICDMVCPRCCCESYYRVEEPAKA